MEQRFEITGMDCANCALTIERGVAKLPDVRAATLNFTTGALRVEGAVDPERVIARVRELGYDVAEPLAMREPNVVAHDHDHGHVSQGGNRDGEDRQGPRNDQRHCQGRRHDRS